MKVYRIVAVRRVDAPFVPGEAEVLEFLDKAGEASVETLDNIANMVDNVGPINLPFVLGFMEGYIKKTMMRTLLDTMAKKGLITILNGKVRITERGRIALKGVSKRDDLTGIPSAIPLSSDGEYMILDAGFYLATVDRPFESAGVVVPDCYMGLYRQFVEEGEKHVEFFVPIRTRLPLFCSIRLRELKD